MSLTLDINSTNNSLSLLHLLLATYLLIICCCILMNGMKLFVIVVSFLVPSFLDCLVSLCFLLWSM